MTKPPWNLGRRGLAVATLGCTAALAALGAAPAWSAASVATTGGATAITSTSAVLSGVVNTGGIESLWAFQYGTTKAYDHTKPNPVKLIAPGQGAFAVSATIDGLTPSTTYHFRLAVVQGSYPASYSTGADMTFRTSAPTKPRPPGPKYGTALLLSHRFGVVKGIAFVPFRCAGVTGAKCIGRISLSAGRATRKHTGGVSCGTAMLRASALGQKTVRVGVPGSCLSLIAKGHGRLGAKLSAKFSTNQRTLNAAVSLFGG